jgi:hypothetical protein
MDLRELTYHHAVNNFGHTVLVSVPVETGPIPKHFFDQFCFLLKTTNYLNKQKFAMPKIAVIKTLVSYVRSDVCKTKFENWAPIH